MTKEFRSFEDAKEFVQKLGLKSYTEWEEYRKSGNKPDNIPSDPGRTYKNIFKGYSDFLGTGRTRNFRSFEDARKFVHLLKIKGGKQWREYCESGNKPKDIPSSPYHVYKNKGWISYGDWLGTGTIASYNIQFKTYSNAKQFVVKLNLKSKTEWDVYCKSGNKPNDIPNSPWYIYSKKRKK